MTDATNRTTAVELLQQLGLKEYEAKAFVALSRLPQGTAKEVSNVSEVPRTRVYDAIRVLESKGLVEIQHSNPQQFRAVSINEAVETLQDEYEDRTDALREALQDVETVPGDAEEEAGQEVWTLAGTAAIANRTQQLVDDSERETVLVVGRESVFTDELHETLQAAERRGVDVIVGTVSELLREHVAEELPSVEVFRSELDWLSGAATDDDIEITRLLMVDRSTILVSTVHNGTAIEDPEEQAVFGTGFTNGLVVIARRLMATGLLPGEDPGTGYD